MEAQFSTAHQESAPDFGVTVKNDDSRMVTTDLQSAHGADRALILFPVMPDWSLFIYEHTEMFPNYHLVGVRLNAA